LSSSFAQLPYGDLRFTIYDLRKEICTTDRCHHPPRNSPMAIYDLRFTIYEKKMNQATKQPDLQATPLRGWITSTHTIYKGKKLGPYHSRTWKVAGKIKREYIKPADLERVRAACVAYKETRKRQSANSQNVRCMVGNLNYIARLCKRLRSGIITQADINFVAELNDKGYDIPGRPKMRIAHPFPLCRDDRARQRGKGQGMGVPISALNAQLLLLPAQYPAPNTQHLTKSFMYPFVTKSSKQGDLPLEASVDLRLTTDDLREKRPLSPRQLKEITAMLKKPLHDRRAKESTDQKWSRWMTLLSQQPISPANVKRALPKGLTHNRIQTDVTRFAELIGQNPVPPKNLPPINPPKARPPSAPPKFERPFPWEITKDDPRHPDYESFKREAEKS
jgi:hypothetical protein